MVQSIQQISTARIEQYTNKLKELEEKRQNKKKDPFDDELLQSLPFDLVVHILDFFSFKVSHIYHKLDSDRIHKKAENNYTHNQINKFFFGFKTQDNRREIRLLFRTIVFTDVKENKTGATERDYFTNKGQTVSLSLAHELVRFLPSNIKSLKLSENIATDQIKKFNQLEELLASKQPPNYKCTPIEHLSEQLEKMKSIKYAISKKMFNEPSIYKNLTNLHLFSFDSVNFQKQINQIALIKSLKIFKIDFNRPSDLIFDILLTLPRIESIIAEGIITLQRENSLPNSLTDLSLCGYDKRYDFDTRDMIVTHNLKKLRLNSNRPYFCDVEPFLKNNTTITLFFYNFCKLIFLVMLILILILLMFPI